MSAKRSQPPGVAWGFRTPMASRLLFWMKGDLKAAQFGRAASRGTPHEVPRRVLQRLATPL
jgi:hypothetical protein